MSTFEHKEGKGSLLVNSYKKGDTQPDFKGSIKINGQTYQVAAWRKQTKAGAEMISLSVDQGWSGSPNMPRVSVPDPADDMPF
jgi:uncharacterized protein (DUF736 family)